MEADRLDGLQVGAVGDEIIGKPLDRIGSRPSVTNSAAFDVGGQGNVVVATGLQGLVDSQAGAREKSA